MKFQTHLVVIASILVMLAIFMRVLPAPRNVDDSFITFRYSRNIVEGQGFVYNPGVQTLGTTTPLYTLVMAGAGLLTGGGENYPWYALIVNACADAATAVLLFLLARRATGSVYPGILVGLLHAIAAMSVTFAISGMETSVNVLWIVAATYAFVHDRKVWVGVLAGLGLLTRIDAAIWILPLGLWQLGEMLITSRRVPWQTWLAGLVTIAPWVGFSLFYFGTPIPNSLGAKSVAYHTVPFQALTGLLQIYSIPFNDFEAFGSTGAMLGAVLYPTLSLFAILYVFRKEHRLVPFLVYPWLYFAIFAAANPLVFRWYWQPPMPAWIFGAVIGAWALITPLAERTRPKIVYPVLAVLLGVLWGGMSLSGWTLNPDHGPERPAPKMAWHALELNYREMGLALREEYGVTPETRVASADIGVIGFYSRATIVDTVGLVTPELSEYYPFDDAIRVKEPDEQNYAVPPQLILDTQPEYFVTMEGFVRQGLEQVPAFTDAYEIIREIPMDIYGTGMRLYARQSPS